jgi:hypothetical protein
MLLASFRKNSRIELLFRREAGHSATPPQGLSALLFFERGAPCSCSSLPLLLSSLPLPAALWQLSGATVARHTSMHACARSAPDNISVAGGAASYRFPLLSHFMEAHNG